MGCVTLPHETTEEFRIDVELQRLVDERESIGAVVSDRRQAKRRILGTAVSSVSAGALMALVSGERTDRAFTVAFCNVHTVMTSRRDLVLATAIESMDVAAPDGKPVSWALRVLVGSDVHIRGTDFFRAALRAGVDNGWKHYLYGSTPETLDELAQAAAVHAPGVQIAGSESPQFRPQTHDERDASLQRIRDSGADLVWVGLGMPKQELWMIEVRDQLPGKVLLGVGAAFDFMAGQVKEAPRWMQRAGLEWVYRLAHDPGRLWRRYLWNNPAFLLLLAMQVMKERVLRRRPKTLGS